LGLFNRSTKPSEDLIENGIKGRATVEKAHMGSVTNYSGPMREKTVEQLLSGETSMTRYKLDLRVELPGREPYSAQATVSVPMGKMRFMTGGSVLPVLVDPNKNSRVNVDWDGEFEQGTLADMAAANPMIAAAMKGAGVDIESISRAQSAAVAAGQRPGNVIIGGQLTGAAPAAAAPDLPDELKRLADLRDSGALTDEEFAAAKAKLLA
jgi:Short C-terminal domain